MRKMINEIKVELEKRNQKARDEKIKAECIICTYYKDAKTKDIFGKPTIDKCCCFPKGYKNVKRKNGICQEFI